MNLRIITAAVAVLAILATALILLNRPAADAPATAGALAPGQTLLTTAQAEKVTRVEIYEKAKGEAPAVVVERAGGGWVVPGQHGLPADVGKLRRFVDDLLGAKVDRVVTSNAARMERLDLGQRRIVLKDAGGATVLDLPLGKNADGGGGMFARPGNEGPAILVSTTMWLDTSGTSWSDRTPLAIKPEDVAEAVIGYTSDVLHPPLKVRRDKPESPFTAEGLAEGETLKADDVNRLISTLINASWTEVVPDAASEDVAGAKGAATAITLTTFAGEKFTVGIGRRPAPSFFPADALASAGASGSAVAPRPARPEELAPAGSEPAPAPAVERAGVVEAYTPPIAIVPEGTKLENLPPGTQVVEIPKQEGTAEAAPAAAEAAALLAAAQGAGSDAAAADPVAAATSALQAAASAPAEAPKPPEPPKPGPVFAFYDVGGAANPWRGVTERVGLKVADYVFTALPQTRAALVNPPPPKPAEAEVEAPTVEPPAAPAAPEPAPAEAPGGP